MWRIVDFQFSDRSHEISETFQMKWTISSCKDVEIRIYNFLVTTVPACSTLTALGLSN